MGPRSSSARPNLAHCSLVAHSSQIVQPSARSDAASVDPRRNQSSSATTLLNGTRLVVSSGKPSARSIRSCSPKSPIVPVPVRSSRTSPRSRILCMRSRYVFTSQPPSSTSRPRLSSPPPPYRARDRGRREPQVRVGGARRVRRTRRQSVGPPADQPRVRGLAPPALPQPTPGASQPIDPYAAEDLSVRAAARAVAPDVVRLDPRRRPGAVHYRAQRRLDGERVSILDLRPPLRRQPVEAERAQVGLAGAVDRVVVVQRARERLGRLG